MGEWRGGPPNGGCDFPAELAIWLSPSFPSGAFGYSQGLEQAVADRLVRDRDSLLDWLRVLTHHGALRNDVIIVSLVRQAADAAAIGELAQLCLALQPTKERAEEAVQVGQAFLTSLRAGWLRPDFDPDPWLDGAPVTYPVAVGLAARLYRFEILATLVAFAVAYHTNLVSAAIRLGAIGQFDGQRVLAALMPEIRCACKAAERASQHGLGQAAFGADLASMQHETLETRLFRS